MMFGGRSWRGARTRVYRWAGSRTARRTGRVPPERRQVGTVDGLCPWREHSTMAAVASLAHVVRARLRLAQARGSLAAWARVPGTDSDVERAALDDAGTSLVL